jgi:amino acid adenylation domain-containing protein
MVIKYKAGQLQEGIWVHACEHSFAYWNFISTRCFSGTIDINKLKHAFRRIIGRHESLRTKFCMEKMELQQIVYPDVIIEDILIIEQIPDDIFINERNEVRTLLQQYLTQPVDPVQEFPYKLIICSTNNWFSISLILNHLIGDNYSTEIFWRDLFAIYENPEIMLPASVPYRSYAEKQQVLHNSGLLSAQYQYWEKIISTPAEETVLPFSKDSDREGIYYSERNISLPLLKRLRNFAMRNRVLISALFQFTYGLLLQRYTGVRTFRMGNVYNGRRNEKGNYDNTMGLFANRLLNVFVISPDQDLVSALTRVNQEVLRSYANSDIPFEEVLRGFLQRNKDRSAKPFSAVFNFMKTVDQLLELPEFREFQLPTEIDLFNFDTQYDIYLVVADDVNTMKIRLALKADKKFAEMSDIVIDSYIELLDILTIQPNHLISNLPKLSRVEYEIISAINKATVTDIGNDTVISIFTDIAIKHADQAAVVSESGTLTYRELNEFSSRLAAKIISGGVRNNSIVALTLTRTPAMFISILAVLKAGGVYLPVDPALPADRVSYMCQNAKAEYIITDIQDHPLAAWENCWQYNSIIEAPQEELISIKCAQPGDLAYIIYTSGSTGNPKAVLIGEESLTNFIRAMQQEIDLADQKILCLTTISFDIFVVESLLALCSGATVVLADEQKQADPFETCELIRKNQVDIVQLTPSRLKLLLASSPEFLRHVKTVLVGGERLTVDLFLKATRNFNGKIFNLYGPTETTVWSTIKELKSGTTDITIGRPIINTGIYILDTLNNSCGFGVWGELAISGRGLAKGYLTSDPTINNEKFILLQQDEQVKVYKTGDRARWLMNGEIEISGRFDDQLKIRGYRIEPGEIEFRIKSYPGITDAAVIQASGLEEDLIAYYTADGPIDQTQLRYHLRAFLPSYMEPSVFVHCSRFPVTFNGKTDRSALRKNIPANLIRATGEMVQEKIDPVLYSVWSQALQLDTQASLGTAETDFFELGGHSLKALYMLEELKKKTGITVTMREFFQNPTIAFLQDRMIIQK